MNAYQIPAIDQELKIVCSLLMIIDVIASQAIWADTVK